MLTSVTLVGCYQTFGKGGSLDRALEADQKDMVDVGRKSPIYKKYCSNGRERTELCRWALANPKEAEALIGEEEE
jgi:hypothetical protein